MNEWWKKFEFHLKTNSLFFMSLLSGVIIFSSLTSTESELAIKYHYLFGLCCAWIGVSFLGVIFNAKNDSDTSKDS
jgi:hypothetical protein